MHTSVDLALSERYHASLESELSDRIVGDAGAFLCPCADECRTSASTKRYGFAAGQLSYVGDAYACRVATAPLRILIVSMQVGDAEAPVTMRRRTEQIHGRILEAPGKRNPHMRGVTRALQLLHGLGPNDEYLRDGTHVLRAYAMANSVLCSALPTDGRSRRGKPTARMLENCAPHLSRTIQLLEPVIIHTQGADTKSAVERVTELVTRHSSEVSTVLVADRPVVLCATSHPAAGPPLSWSSTKPGSYFADTVRPAMLLARDLALQPV
jgi:uracil-DNA glycosylase